MPGAAGGRLRHGFEYFSRVLGRDRRGCRRTRERGFHQEALAVADQQLVTGTQQRLGDRMAIDEAAPLPIQLAQHHAAPVREQLQLAVGDARLVQADVGIAGTAQRARAVQREAAPMMDAADAAQYLAVRDRRLGLFVRDRLRLGSD